MNSRRVIGGLVLSLLASVLVAAVLAALSDARQVASALTRFPLVTLLAMLALSLACFALRSIRWAWLMRLVGTPMSLVDATYLQVAGQTMTITPGRVGEILKPWLAKRLAGLSMSRGIALAFAERVADLIAVCVLSLGAVSILGGSTWALPIALAAILAGTAVASSGRFHALALRVVEKQRWARRHHSSAGRIAQTLGTALNWRALLWSTPVSVVAWGLEGVGFWLCLRALGVDGVGLLLAISIYAIATIVGAFTFLPGGIGLTEASMAGLLVATGVGAPEASAATLITRLATLWWGVGVGWLALLSRPAVLKEMLAEQSATEVA